MPKERAIVSTTAGHKRFARTTLSMEPLEQRKLLDADPIINEFLASNDTTLDDGYGNSSDWLEVLNAGDMFVDLGGWYLTDDVADLTKWQFPNDPVSELEPGEFLVVFASNVQPDQLDPAGNPHANFRLDAGGGPLALVMPDGMTIADEFSPFYPQQFEDVSYGLATETQLTLVQQGVMADVLVPSSSNLGTTWTETDFTPDAAWSNGPTGVGYDLETIPTYVESGGVVVAEAENFTTRTPTAEHNWLIIPDEQATPAGGTHTGARGGKFLQVNPDNGAAAAPFDGPSVAYRVSIQTPGTYRPYSRWQGHDTSSDSLFLRIAELSDGPGGEVADWYEDSGHRLKNFDTFPWDGSGGFEEDQETVSFETMTWDIDTPGVYTLEYAMRETGAALDALVLQLESLSSPSGAGPAESATIDVSRYAAVIGTDIENELLDQNTSVYVRIPFTASDPSDFNQLTLKMKYDDAFVAYLNGVEVARSNVTGIAQWDSAADTDRPDEDALTFETFDISGHINLLEEGQNVLAIHGLNASADATAFLLLPKLEAAEIGSIAYMSPPTPGATNGPGFTGVVADTNFSHDRGFYDAPFSVTITSDTPGAEIFYTTDGRPPNNGLDGEPINATLYSGPIDISSTTPLRALALKDGFVPTNVDTQTYIFVDDVIQQAEMDADIVNDPLYGSTILNDLKAVPTMSIVMNHDDMFGPEGIYTNPQGSGIEWERETSVEYFDPNSTDAFQVDAGIRLHGADARNHAKKPFRLFFRGDYGTRELVFPLFEGSPVDEFDKLVIRPGAHDGWAPSRDDQAPSATYIRDEFMRRVQLEMGDPAARGKYIHLYINGQYWGMYDLTERPDEDFTSEHLGGTDEDWDILKTQAEVVAGDKVAWDTMMAMANTGLTSDTAYQDIQQYLDVDNLIDNVIARVWTGDVDWLRSQNEFVHTSNRNKNWFAARRRDESGRFIFFVWDAEFGFGKTHNTSRETDINVTDVDINDSPGRPYAKLRQNAEFRLRFADHLHKYFFNGGLLTPDVNIARWSQLMSMVEAPLVPESARWGDYHFPADPFTREDDWRPEADWVRNVFLPDRTQTVLDQFKAIDLYPDVDAPVFHLDGSPQYGGGITPGATFSMVDPNLPAGAIHYTIDGTDPRLDGGAISTFAQPYEGSFPVNSAVTIKARVLESGTWSALSDATYTVSQPADASNLAITELNYNPYVPLTDYGDLPASDNDDYEYVELLNTSAGTISLLDVSFTDGFDFTFGNDSLAAGERVLVVRDQAAFEARYGSGLNIAGEFVIGGLRNSGETIRLSDATGGTIVQFTYGDTGEWPGRADGKGATLEAIDVTGNYDDSENWRSSNEYGGSPGSDGTGPVFDVIVNEVLSHSDGAALDKIELYNTTGAEIDFTNWYLSDDGNVLFDKFVAPAASMIPAGGYLVLDETTLGFAFDGQQGDDVWFIEGDTATGKPLRFADHLDFDATETNVTLGRWLNGDPAGTLFPMTSQTLGSANSGPVLGPVILAEVDYNPQLLRQDLEFVELFGVSSAPVDLEAWRLDDAVELTFPTGTTIGLGETLVVVSFDPADSVQANEFRTWYGIDAGVSLVGPYTGNLKNGGERVKLLKPEDPGNPLTGFVLVDQLDYDDQPPWPTDADGGGKSLDRENPSAFSGFVASWTAEDPTPGSVAFAGLADTDLDGDVDFDDIDDFVLGLSSPADYELLHGVSTLLTGDTDQDGDLDFDDIDDFVAILSGGLSAGFGVVEVNAGDDLSNRTGDLSASLPTSVASTLDSTVRRSPHSPNRSEPVFVRFQNALSGTASRPMFGKSILARSHPYASHPLRSRYRILADELPDTFGRDDPWHEKVDHVLEDEMDWRN